MASQFDKAKEEAIVQALAPVAHLLGKDDEYHTFLERHKSWMDYLSKNDGIERQYEELFSHFPTWIKAVHPGLSSLYDFGYANGRSLGENQN